MAQVSLIDVFRRCSAKAQSLRLTASQRSLLYAMMYEWNEANRQSTVQTSFTRLRELAMLPESTMRDALIRLNECNVGFHGKRTSRRDGLAIWFDERDMPAPTSRYNAPAKREQRVSEESANADSSRPPTRGVEHEPITMEESDALFGPSSTADLRHILR